jgi:colicin import membrane protein
MINELQVAERIADGTLPSPQKFGNSTYWAIRISGTGAAWRASEGEFVWREPGIWLTPEMRTRAAALPVLIDHPASGTLNSPEFAARCVGMTTYAYIRGDELWAVARILDSGANQILASGAYEDSSPAVSFRPDSGARIEVDGKMLLIEPEPLLLDHVCFCYLGTWTRDGQPGVETTETTQPSIVNH